MQLTALLLGGSVEQVYAYRIPGTGVRHTVVAVRKTGETPARFPLRTARTASRI